MPGEMLLAHARRVLRQLEQLSGDLQEFVSGVKGQVRVFANTTAMTEFLPAVLRTYLVNHPDVTVDMEERLSRDIVRAVQEGMVDIGILAGNVRTEGLDVMPYRRDRLVLATALSHPLAEQISVDFIDTLDYDFIDMPEASAIHNFLKRAAADLQRELRSRVQVSNFESACRLIEANVASPYCRRAQLRATRVRWPCGSSSSTTNGPSASCRYALQISAHCRCLRASWSTCWSRMASGARTERPLTPFRLFRLSDHSLELPPGRPSAPGAGRRGNCSAHRRPIFRTARKSAAVIPPSVNQTWRFSSPADR